MLYYLFDYLDRVYDFPGAGVFRYISFRSAIALITSLLITLVFGKRIINMLLKLQVGETIRDLGLEGQSEKKGTPTMGGIIIIAGILIPTLLFTRLNNVYIILMIVSTLWLGAIGFVDDYIKVFKKDKEGLRAKSKLLGQVGLGIFVGAVLYFNNNVVVREKIAQPKFVIEQKGNIIDDMKSKDGVLFSGVNTKSTKTTIPFFKNNEFDYADLVSWAGDNKKYLLPLLFIVMVTFIITAVSNGSNITDGIDGLATGTSAIVGITLAVFAYVSGNAIFANYLNIMYIPNTGELMVFMSAFVGACVGFLWYNSFPAQVFMGDTGSLAIGGVIAVFAIAVRKELLIPIICGIFLVENLSVMIQVSYFKYTKKKYGEGRRIFLMSPLHHHFQKKQIPESKITLRFWLITVILVLATFALIKLR